MNTLTLPMQMDFYRLAVVKQCLKLEKLGMHHSRGAIRPMIAKELGLKPRDSYAKYIQAIEAKLKECANESV